LTPLALGAPLAHAPIAELTSAEPYADAAEHVSELLDLAGARAAAPLAQALHAGRIAGIDEIDAAVAHAVRTLAGPDAADANDAADAAHAVAIHAPTPTAATSMAAAFDRLLRSHVRVSAHADAAGVIGRLARSRARVAA